jgi:endonuclease-3
MSASNRQTLINKTFKVLKKHYESVAPPSDRSVLEHLLYACCLENSKHENVDEVFAKLEQNYFDWNEVRVTTVAELAEVMASLPDPGDAAQRLKRGLQGIFETHYSFDLEFFRKQNLGKSIKDIERFSGVTRFAVAYVTQNALNGHAIPINQGVLSVLEVLGVISPAEAAKKRVPGLERAIPKSKGVEFASLLHQLGVDYAATPFSPRLRTVILEIAPDAKDRLPKRQGKKTLAKSGKAKKKAKAAAAPTGRKKKTKSAESAPKKKSTTKRLSRKKPR